MCKYLTGSDPPGGRAAGRQGSRERRKSSMCLLRVRGSMGLVSKDLRNSWLHLCLSELHILSVFEGWVLWWRGCFFFVNWSKCLRGVSAKVRTGEWNYRWPGMTWVHHTISWQVWYYFFPCLIYILRVTCLSAGKGLGKWPQATRALVGLQRVTCWGCLWWFCFCQLLSLYLDLPLKQKASLAGGGGLSAWHCLM